MVETETVASPTASVPDPHAVRLGIWGLLGVLGASAVLVTALPWVLAVIAAVVLGLAAAEGLPWRRAGRLILRMKWFYLSLLVFYGLWPTEGESLAAGLLEAGGRILALVLVLFLVVWLTEHFPRTVLVRSLGRLLGGPRQMLGGWGERFSGRLFLALALFESERPSVEARRAGLDGSRRNRLRAVHEWLVVQLDRALTGGGPMQPSADTQEPAAGTWLRSDWPVVVLWAGVIAAWVAWWLG